jgi:hypothetical protein
MGMSVGQSWEWELTGEAEVLGENLPYCRFGHHKSHMTDLGSKAGRRGGKSATNHLTLKQILLLPFESSDKVLMKLDMRTLLHEFHLFYLILKTKDLNRFRVLKFQALDICRNDVSTIICFFHFMGALHNDLNTHSAASTQYASEKRTWSM